MDIHTRSYSEFLLDDFTRSFFKIVFLNKFSEFFRIFRNFFLDSLFANRYNARR